MKRAKIYIARRHEIMLDTCETDEDPKTIGAFLTRAKADEAIEADERFWIADNHNDPDSLDRDAHVYDDAWDECRWTVEEVELEEDELGK